MENCENKQLLLTGEKTLKDFKWDDPIFYDNSGYSVKVNKTYHSSAESMTEGKNYVLFSAADKYNNQARCMVNLTVQGTRTQLKVVFIILKLRSIMNKNIY